MFGEETAILVEDGQLGEGDAEWVLDDSRVLDLQEFDEVGSADCLDVTTHTMLDEQRAADVETNLEELRFHW